MRHASPSSARHYRFNRLERIALATIAISATARSAIAQLTGALGIHDPSSPIKDGSYYHIFGTGQGIAAKWSSDMTAWNDESSGVFATPPAWTTQHVAGFTGFFWAPEVAYFNSVYHLYYAASSFGTIDSGIGMATSPTLNRGAANYGFTDQGKVVASQAVGHTDSYTDTTAYNAIDPSVLVDSNTGKVWMSWGSYSSGIVVTQLNATTGLRLNTSSLDATLVANNAPGGGWGSSIEASKLIQHGTYYYLIVNYGGCCSGIDSTYNIRVGRSLSPTGPFIDPNGVDMRNGGGSLFLRDDGKMVGPGQFGYYTESGQDYFSYHYYNGDFNGAPNLGIRKLYWTSDGWPSYAAVNPNWTGTANSNWSNAANWSVGGVPNAVGNDANFANNTAGRYSVNIDGGNTTVSSINFTGTSSYTIGATNGFSLTFHALSGDSDTINVGAGSHTIAAPVVASENFAVNVFTSSTLTMTGSVSGPTLSKYGHGALSLGGTSSFTGNVFVRQGTLDITGSVSASQYTSVGLGAGDNGTIVLRGAGSFTDSADLNIGDTGDGATAATGTLNIQDTATVTINSTGGLFIGSGFSANTMAVGTVNQSGGTLTANGNFDGAFIIGGRGSSLATGTYNLSGGTVNANTNVRVGGFGSGTFNQTGGTFNTTKYISIGRYTGATGAWNISAGTLNHTGTSNFLIVGEQGAGTLTVSGSGLVSLAGAMRIGYNAGTGTVNLNGGTILAPAIVRGTGTATFNFNGGTLRSSTSSTTFMQGLTNADVQAGGALIDTQAFNDTIAQPLLHDAALGSTADGGLTKTGAGTLTLSGASTYTGTTGIAAGSLALKGSITNSGSVRVGPGATTGDLQILSGGNLSVGGVFVGSGSIPADHSVGTGSIASGGTISTGGYFAVGHAGATSTGSFTINGGTLNVNTTTGQAANLEVATFDSASGTLNINANSTVRIENNGLLALGAQNTTGNGTINQSGGTVTFYSDGGTTVGGAGRLVLAGAGNPRGTYTYNLNGGTLTVPRIARENTANSPTAVFNFNGGTLRATVSATTYMQGLSSAVVRIGGAKIDTNSFNITISQPLIHDASGPATDGGLTKLGAGTMVLSAANTYTGSTSVNAGTLTLDTAGSLASASLNTQSGATLNLNGNVSASASITSSGAVNIAGNASTTTSAARSIGSVVVNPAGLVTIQPSAVAGKPMVLTTASLSFGNATAKFDLTNNELLTTENLTTLRNQIGSTSLTTTTAGLAVGSLDIGSGQVEARATYLGDTNLDGTVDVTDLGNLATGYGASTGAVWSQGDFDYNGTVDVSDLGDLASTYGGDLNSFGSSAVEMTVSTAMPMSIASVPEPSQLAAVTTLAAGLMARRRSRRSGPAQRVPQRFDVDDQRRVDAVFVSVADAGPLGHGPGTELHAILANMGIHPHGACSCRALMHEMNSRGPLWCRANLPMLAARMNDEAQRRGWAIARRTGKLTTLAARQLVRLAIRRAERNQFDVEDG